MTKTKNTDKKAGSPYKKRKLKASLPTTQTYLKQANVLTFGKYDFTAWQLKGLVVIIEELQEATNLIIDTKKEPVQLNLFANLGEPELFKEVAEEGKPATIRKDVVQFKIPLKRFGVANSHYDKLRDALRATANIPVELNMSNENGEHFRKFTSLFQAICPEGEVKVNEQGQKYKERINYVYIEMEKGVLNSLLTLDKGYTRFLKEIVMSQSSKYVIRIYLFISAMKKRGGAKMSYSRFQQMLGIEKDEYKNYNDFKKRVLDVSFNALHEKADCWFYYSEEYNSKSKTIPSFLVFKIVTATKTALEEESLDVRKRALKDIFETHFLMNKKQVEELLSYLNPENYTYMVNHIHRIKDYIKAHDIAAVADYAYKALINEFKHEIV